MLYQTIWTRSAQRVARYLQTSVTLANAERKEEILEIFEKAHLLFPQWAIMTCPRMHPDLHYMSLNSIEVLGHPAEYLVNPGEDRLFLANVHGDDQKALYDCYSFLYDHMEELSPQEHHTMRGIIYYRFRKANGQYIHLQDEKASLYLNDGSNFYYALFQDVSETRPFTGVKIEIWKRDLKTVKKLKEFRPSSLHPFLSKREKELVSLIRQGFSTKQIASHLNISPNTVRNMKSRLFEKYNVGNSIELLNATV